MSPIRPQVHIRKMTDMAIQTEESDSTAPMAPRNNRVESLSSIMKIPANLDTEASESVERQLGDRIQVKLLGKKLQTQGSVVRLTKQATTPKMENRGRSRSNSKPKLL